MATCRACGQENPEGFRFCGACGAAFAHAPAREERKVVSVLFADLVGFTSRSERLDPEDVRAMVSPYFARVRAEIERHGGTVEKFIGDAVMALFGAPTAHEDDPERAVRAALAIRDSIGELNDAEPALELQLRQAVNTGEALVSLGARPSEGEGMASGDVLNTAARLQAAAPVNGILVGERTYRATRHAIDYREAAPVEAKGKAERVPVWEVVGARARFGLDVETHARSPLVGRDRELGFLVDALARARSEPSCQLVTLVGVPGIGKSRLVAELFGVVDRDPEFISWRQGRSLPYGESMSFWALGEITKSQAGILETDSLSDAGEKVRAMVDELALDEPESGWVEQHLRPLVGLSTTVERGAERRSEAFSAWRRYLETLAETRPLVLVFEDLHWADEGLLDFVDHLADWVSGVPLLIVCTARPELLDRRPGWGGGKRNAATLSIAALSPEETTRLVGGLLEEILLPAQIHARLVERAEGNPLYAEEYVRMLQDRGFLIRGESGRRIEEDRELPLPETVQGMVAARLDALPAAEKELVLDAAVVGKVFWPGTLAALDRRSGDGLADALHALERKEFVRRERRSAVAGETQYAFLHLLVRDVAYGQIPRTARIDKHRLVAEWTESLAADRSEDRAEMRAHHYLEALTLAAAAGVDVEPLRRPAGEALVEAVERSFVLSGWASAVRFGQAALDLGGLDPIERGRLLLRIGEARWYTGDNDPAPLEEARDTLVEHDEIELAAKAETLISEMKWLVGDIAQSRAHQQNAVALVEERPLSHAKAIACARQARLAALAGDAAAVDLGRRALGMAEELGSDAIASNALNTIGLSRCQSGDPGGLADLERSVGLAQASNAPDLIHSALNNLANMNWQFGLLDVASDWLATARRRGERFGNTNALRWLDGEDMLDAELRGDWDRALALADRIIESAASSPHYLEAAARVVRTRVALGRGDTARALIESERALALGRGLLEPQALTPPLVSRVRALVESGQASEAVPLVEELLAEVDFRPHVMYEAPLLLAQLGRGGDYLDAVAEATGTNPWVDAGRAVAGGNFLGAAAIYADIGVRAAEADARLLAAEALVAEGKRAEADAELRRSLAHYRRVGATAYAARGEALLAPSA